MDSALVSATLPFESGLYGTLTSRGGCVSCGVTLTAFELVTLVFNPSAIFNGAASFTFTVNDADLGTLSASYDITDNAVNDVPVATGNTESTNEDTSLSLYAAEFL